MLAKFSVKKPFTVLVAVILIIILGAVSFSRMTPDLLPSIELPYVVVVTTYMGASPEEIETTITKPIEQTTATLDNIKQISSVSNENYSMVVLEFSNDVNMDAATMNIREKLDVIGGAWNDYVGTPIILKLNPDMLPLGVYAVNRTGMSAVELSAFYENTLSAKLEGVEGVASVSASGLIAESVNIVLDQAKIDAKNVEIAAAIDEQFKATETKLDDAQMEIFEGIVGVENGKTKIKNGSASLKQAKKELQAQIDQALAQLDQPQAQLLQLKLDTVNEIANLDRLITDTQSAIDLIDSRATVESAKNIAASKVAALQPVKDAYENASGDPAQDTAVLQALSQAQLDLSTTFTLAEALEMFDSYQSSYDQAVATLSRIDTLVAANGGSDSAAITALKANITTYRGLSAQAMGVLAGVNTQLAQLQGASDAITQQGEQAKAQMAEAQSALRKALNQVNDSVVAMAEAQAQVDASRDQVEDSKQTAKDGTDLHTLLSLSNLSGILSAQNFSMPAGYATEQDRKWLVYVGDKIMTAEELSDMILFDLGMDDVAPIRVSDVADVLVVDNASSNYAKINGNDGVLLSLNKQSGYATADVSENIQKTFASLSDSYEGLTFTTLMDQGDYIHLVVNSVLQNLILGGVLAILILLLFLRDIRPTFIIACSIPISVTFAFVLMYFSGVTLNIISMSGLAVGVGMLVDNSIVVIENIYRLRKQGVSPFRAAISGAVQVAGAITASTLTTVCVFLPIVFIEGITRQLFQDMALTIAYSLLASLIIALTLVPAMASGLLKKTSDAKQKAIPALTRAYEKSLRFALKHRASVLVVAVTLLAVSIVIAVSKGFSYMPDMASTQMNVTVELDEDATFDETTAMLDLVAERIRTLDEVETTGTMLSQGMGSMVGMSDSSANTTSGSVYVVLNESGRSSLALEPVIEELCEDLDCTVTASGASGMGGISMLSGGGVSVEIYGSDLATLRQAATEIGAILQTVDGIASVNDGLEATAPALSITVDKEKAMRQGLTVAQVYAAVSKRLTTDGTATSIEETDQDVTVTLPKTDPTVQDVRDMTIDVTQKSGVVKRVALSEIATFTESETLQSINRVSQRRYITVAGTLKDGYNVTLVTRAAEKALSTYSMPQDGMYLEFAGENETIMNSMNDLLLMLILGVVIVYLIMVAQFQSLLSPFIVMMTIPLAFTGGLFALLLAGMDISIVAMIGFIMLVGIIVNNGIVLIDMMNRLRMDGMERRDAVIEAGVTRLRPVLMTALTTVLGLVPLGFGVGMGAGLVQPVAVVAIGGLIYATFMTLYVVPILYDMMVKRPPRVVTQEDMTLIEE